MSSGALRRTLLLQAAVADNGVSGVGGGLPWVLPEDFDAFLSSTAGGVLLLGRLSLWPGASEAGRRAIVLSRDAGYAPPAGVALARSFDEALALADALPGGGALLHVCGGEAVYAAALACRDRPLRLRLTEVHATPDGDRRFPPWRQLGRWRELSRRAGAGAHTFVELERVSFREEHGGGAALAGAGATAAASAAEP